VGWILVFFIQYLLAALLMVFSLIISWYEGSAIVDLPWEWEYSTPISHMLYGEVVSGGQISQLDYLVYAAKFRPIFPALFVMSGLYLLVLFGFHVLKGKQRRLGNFLFLLGVGLVCLALLFISFVTTVGYVFFYIWLLGGVLCLGAGIYLFMSNRGLKEVVE
jgi:hypothetical protein